MRPEPKASSDDTEEAAMADKPKGVKRSRFKFGKGSGNKKENGLIPTSSSNKTPVEETPELGIAVPIQDIHLLSLSRKPPTEGYTLSNADVINGTISASDTVAHNDKGEGPKCTCPHPPDPETSTVPPPPDHQPAYARPDSPVRLNGRVNGNHGNQMSVVAVIEGGGSTTSTLPLPVPGSEDSSPAASVYPVRPRAGPPISSIEASVASMVTSSPQGMLSRVGNKSPSSQSLVSVASSTVPMDMAGDSPFNRIGSDRPKWTLGDIIQQMEERAKNLHCSEDFTTPALFPDLQFLAHQSRYSSDIHVKRRLIAKLVDCKVVDIFLKVFRSVHTVDYLGEDLEALGGNRPRSKSASDPSSEDVRPLNGQMESVSTCALASTSEDLAESTTELALSESSHQMQENNADSKSLVSTDDVDMHGAHTSGINLKNGANNNNNNVPAPLKNLRAAVTLMWNTTDKSPILCEECIRQGVVAVLLSELQDPRLSSPDLKDQQRLSVVKGYLGILNNIVCFFNDTREVYRDAGAIKTLQPYLKSSLLLIKTKTIMLLSYIISESENDLINASDKNIGFAVKMLEACLEKDNHCSKKFGFWAVEVAAGLNRLGNFEANKERIVQKGVLPLYHQLMLRPCSEDEQLIAAQGIWIFAFSEKAQNTIKEDARILEALHILHRTAVREEIKRAASGALWIIEGRGSGVGAVPKSPRLPAGAGHIYVSYHWSCKPFVVRLRDKLRSFGYKVFVDTDNMGTCGLPLELMFEAMEKTCVILLCMTQKYKDSPSCRNEVEHGCRLRRDMIPIRLQQRYNADGWLATVTNSRLVFDFSREENLENVTAGLVRELGPRGRSKSALAAAAAAASVGLGDRDASRSPSNQSVASGATAGSQGLPSSGAELANSKAGLWNEGEVTGWLLDNGLTGAIDKFQSINGELLCEMKKMHHMAPECFYTMLRNELNFDWITQLRFTRALDLL